jgi:hypothetical protein
MRQVSWRTWLVGAMLAMAAMGCQALSGKSGIPEDPLFASRKPIESKAMTAAPIAVAFVEPPVPQDPDIALASGKDKMSVPSGPTPGKVPGILTSQPGGRRPGPDLPTVKPR